jgi:molecular chaperone HtpG
MAQKGTINVQTDNIFPIIKKFLYSDHEIFLRELISNAVDATNKLKTLSRLGEFQGKLGDLKIEIEIKDGKLIIRDRGLGMTEEEVEKYINEVAFSGARDFMSKYEGKMDGKGMIGNFGLGFYSSFMVADKVEIHTKSYKDEPGVHWLCEGNPEYKIKRSPKKSRGTEITLHIAEDSKEFLEDQRIQGILDTYAKFLPVEIKFGSKKEVLKEGEGDEATEKEIEIDNIINNPEPAWTQSPSELSEDDYKSFYRELYPMSMDEPLFHIHLNVDYPFNLTGILYFPKIKEKVEVQQDRIQLYSNQVFVTDNVEGIVPDFLTLLHGVIDSPDIPLNVSRSYLQSDSNVKKISSHISKKVSDRLEEMFKNERDRFEKVWEEIKVIVEYGMLSDEKFFERAEKYALYPNTNGAYYTFSELEEKLAPVQTDKDGNKIFLYTNDQDQHFGSIRAAEEKGYEVLLLDSPIIGHLLQRLEMKHEKVSFRRVDSDSLEKLIPQEQDIPARLSQEEQDALKGTMESVINDSSYNVQFESLNPASAPFSITQSEFLRRMKEMSRTGGNMFGGFMGSDMYNVVVNANHDLIERIKDEKDEEKQGQLIRQGLDLAKLAQGLLKGEDLDNFIRRSTDMI